MLTVHETDLQLFSLSLLLICCLKCVQVFLRKVFKGTRGVAAYLNNFNEGLTFYI